MEEGEIYAIETFGTTGKGYVREDGECSHFMKDFENQRQVQLKHPISRQVLNYINQNHDTLAFCKRWVDDSGIKNSIIGIKELCR